MDRIRYIYNSVCHVFTRADSRTNQITMDYKEAKMLHDYPEQFVEYPIDPVEAQEHERQYEVAMKHFQRFMNERNYWGINRVGGFMERMFSIDLSNK